MLKRLLSFLNRGFSEEAMQAHSFIVIVYKFSNSNANVYIVLF